ncbi:muscleblind-like protein isoform X6 [Aethina tumida]|uniref:muscleblind-like protein isoform X6 n=1 Tax=Aethina tumida TaxID=116153 RepID=UPI002148FDCB|nr:muscleblind-like protein isoform X6 [Aethina tumida]
MAMVNMNNLLNGKDSRWLQLEVCREFQRNKCSRPDTECKFAHPPANVEVQNGRVTACYDSIKGRCNREKPPCKYFHPPQHLKDQLLINGRNHLALKNALMQQMGLTPGQPIVPGQVQAVMDPQLESIPLTFFPHLSMSIDEQYAIMAANPYLTGMPQVGSTYSPYFAPGPIMPTIMGPDPTGVGSPLGVVPQTVVAQQKLPRSDRLEPAAAVSPMLAPQAQAAAAAAAALEIGKKRPREPSNAADTDLLLMDMKSVGSFYYDNFQAFPGMMPYKRPAADKSGVPVYQPNATTYQQLMQLQQPFVPVSCEYSGSPAPPTSTRASPPTSESCSQQSTTSTQPSQPSVAAAAAQLNKESEAAAAAASLNATSVATTAAAVSILSAPQTATAVPDPATLAKEVAQQNYAKAVKLAAVNHSLAASQLQQQLNPLNYTGVALNKQTLSVPPPPFTRYSTVPIGIGPTGLNLGLTNPYQAAAMAQQNLLNATRPPPTIINPYSIIRSPYSATTAPATNAILGNGLLTAAQYPASVSSAPITNVSAATNIAAAAVQNNNNVVMQPYKKLKTT